MLLGKYNKYEEKDREKEKKSDQPYSQLIVNTIISIFLVLTLYDMAISYSRLLAILLAMLLGHHRFEPSDCCSCCSPPVIIV